MKRLIFLLINLSIYFLCFSQDEKLSEAIISEIEQMTGNEPEMAEQITEKLADLSENPVNINSQDLQELSRLFFLTDFQVRSIADYVRTTGSIVSVYELGNITGFDPGLVRMILPFIVIRPVTGKDSDNRVLKNRLIMNFTDKSDYSETSYSGSSYKLLIKYRFDSGIVSGNLTAEKDAGEPLLYGKPPLPDFVSGNLALKGTGAIKKIIIGDYSARFGLGTAVNTSFRTGLSVSSPGFIGCRDELKQHTSTEENNFFRGVAIEAGSKNMSIRMFYSLNRSDAVLDSSDGLTLNRISSFYTSGLHNTISMMQRKDNYTETSMGLNFFYNLRNAGIGLTFSDSRFSIPLRPDVTNPEKIHRFSGDRSNLWSVYYSALTGRIILAGEFTLNNRSGHALVQTVSLKPADRLGISILFRHYSEDFINFHGKGPGISSSTCNETGLTGSFSLEAMKHLFIFGGADIHFFPWLKYRTTGPSSGSKQEIRILYTPDEKIEAEFSFRLRTAMTDFDKTAGIPEPQKINIRTFKGIVRYMASENLKFSARLDYCTESQGPGKGVMFLHDTAVRLKRLPLSIWFRYSIFSTDSWNSRIYAYENDLLYSFSVPALSGRGSRNYIMVSWKISDKADLRIKYGITSKMSEGNLQAVSEEIKLQFTADF